MSTSEREKLDKYMKREPKEEGGFLIYTFSCWRHASSAVHVINENYKTYHATRYGRQCVVREIEDENGS